MTQDTVRSSKLEVAHVLFMDIVGFSLSPMDEQSRLLEYLQVVLRNTPEYKRGEASGDMLARPRGDGVVLIFFRDPLAPIHCAFEVWREVRQFPDLKLRMGVHSGPVQRVEDITRSTDVTGGGIVLAQRTMDCGDAGHILVSSSVAEFLRQLDHWGARLHDLGEIEVKHGAKIHLYNLFTEDVGNPEVPDKVRSRTAEPTPELPSRPQAASRTPELGRVAILYKRNAQPDGQLLRVLETELDARGYSVFVDRSAKPDRDWSLEIERQIRSADAVIPLLSAASISSEMLEFWIQIAHEAPQNSRGGSRLLPIRIDLSGPLPEAMGAVLDRLRYSIWSGPSDDARVVGEIVHALEHPEESRAREPAAKPEPPPSSRLEGPSTGIESSLEPAGGAVPLTSKFYVERPTDEQFYTAIARHDSIVLVKGARQMGKTSLLARGIQKAREAGDRVVLTDFQSLNAEQMVSPDTLFRALAGMIADDLDLDVLPDDTWDSKRGPNVNFERYIKREVLQNDDRPLVWGLDEVDRLFTSSFGSEVFGLFRSWHNRRSLDPYGPWSRMTLAIAYAREAHLFITDVNQSPFNVGTRIPALEDFTFDQVSDLNRRHGSPLQDNAEVARYYRLVNGQPYLVRRGLYQMAAQGIGIAALEAQADRDEGIFGDHLRRILVLLFKDPELCDVMRGVLRGEPCGNQNGFYRLRSAGVMAGDSARDARLRCQLYATYLEKQLL